MKIDRVLFIFGAVLSTGWLYFYAFSTFQLIFNFFTNEPYYIDVVRFYLLPYALAPFVLLSYINGIKQKPSNSLKSKQWVTFIFLTCFALLQLFESAAFFYAFFSTFTKFEFTREWFWLLFPIGFFLFFILLARFLFQTRNSWKSIQAA